MPFVPDNQLTPGQARHAELMTFLTAFRNEWSKTMADLNASLPTRTSTRITSMTTFASIR